MPQTHYEVLGVAITATPNDIRKAYQALARRWHPDLSAHLTDSAQHATANERFKLITAAYNTLNHPDQRRKYDATRQSARPTRKAYSAPPQTNTEREEALRQAQERVYAQSREGRERVERMVQESHERVARLIGDAAIRHPRFQTFRDL